MISKLLSDANLFYLLYLIDLDLAEQCRQLKCPYCGSVLHYARYSRKPRGGPNTLPEEYMIRHGLCCSGEYCRRRTLPASCLFMGRRLAQREVRSFEASHCNGLWHLDFHHARRRIVDSAGRWHTPVALCVLDDFSRLCCHIQWYLSETAEDLFHGLKQAFLKRGLPRALMTDNGGAMTAHETENGLKPFGYPRKWTVLSFEWKTWSKPAALP